MDHGSITPKGMGIVSVIYIGQQTIVRHNQTVHTARPDDPKLTQPAIKTIIDKCLNNGQVTVVAVIAICMVWSNPNQYRRTTHTAGIAPITKNHGSLSFHHSSECQHAPRMLGMFGSVTRTGDD
jgi:hypothetical protein